MMVINTYAEFPLAWAGEPPLVLNNFSSNSVFDYERHWSGVRAYFSDNMAAYLEMGKIYNLSHPNYYLSMVRRDGRPFEATPYVKGLVDRLFPKGYEFRVVSLEEAKEYGFPLLYPLWVFDGKIFRQSKRHYDFVAIAYVLIQWVRNEDELDRYSR